ncbi:threonine--tRNA ligase [Aliikangiella marina]|uniref:Threonine--tRNA ligase n=1 Tax=Aliikangiella marina TaxID=1712262 RepID=A0A545TIP3_9GAMM|nr:threonine--tRNA ligase [Aliikangiella marina]TQV77046.1 threonine--tRNA ligase [Aliikangiella marina]
MPVITLPDGSQREFDNAVTVYQVAADIGPGLAKAALAGKVDGQLVDTSYIIDTDAELSLITDRDAEGLEVIRHSCAHLLAQATQAIFPKAQVTIGPVIDDGFYYDFAFSRPFTPDDLVAIEDKMAEIVKKDLPVERTTMERDEAVKFFRDMGEEYKAEIISSIPAGEELSLYRQGDFIDLCRGPHVPSTGRIKAFKLMKLAGAYWRGDSNNEMLQRVYGTAWANKKDLKKYLHRLEEAEKRDHRKIGKALSLFHFQEESPGMVFWHNDGWTIFKELETYIRQVLRDNDYQEVKAPQVLDRSLWEKSGHWDKFKDDMFTTESENRTYAVKPMNCPGHILIYNQGLKSYRDLPLKIAEFGSCHRNEPSGALHGLMRVRGFTQDDAHVFCTEAQIQEEVSKLIDMIYAVYADFGFDKIEIKLSTRPEKRVGDDAIWDQSEKALADALVSKDIEYELQPGEGAFYGPKIEFALRDCLDRVWQCGTVQLDFSMPGRLGAEYVSEEGDKKIPVMIHRAVLGSLERFIGILIEEYAGKFPPWLSPNQAVIMNITDKQSDYVKKCAKYLNSQGFRVNSDLRNEKIGFKIRQHTLQRVPFLLVAGDKEVESGTLSVRTRGGKDLGSLSLEDFAAHLQAGIEQKGRYEE